MTLQGDLAKAAKTAGVKLFVPSEFGGDMDGRNDGIFGLKNAQRQALTEIGMPWTAFWTGPFGDWFFLQP
jgi:hypothetical protein